MKPIEFKPTIAKLQQLKKEYSNLEIKDESDKAGYAMVDTARKELKKMRVAIQKEGKERRAEAVAVQKAIIKAVKDSIEIIEPLEKELQLKQLLVDNKKELPKRLNELKEIKVEIEESVLLKMNNREYKNFFDERKNSFLEEQARKLQEIEDEKKRKEDLLEAKRKARIAEKERQELKLKNEKIDGYRRLFNSFVTLEQFDEWMKSNEWEIDEQVEIFNSAKNSLITKLNNEKQVKEEEEEKRLKNQRYQEWLKQNNFEGETMILKQTETEIIMYKVVSTFKK